MKLKQLDSLKDLIYKRERLIEIKNRGVIHIISRDNKDISLCLDSEESKELLSLMLFKTEEELVNRGFEK